jgi:hypothetical protein
MRLYAVVDGDDPSVVVPPEDDMAGKHAAGLRRKREKSQ